MSTGDENIEHVEDFIPDAEYWREQDERIQREEELEWESQGLNATITVHEITNEEFGIFHDLTNISGNRKATLVLILPTSNPTKDIKSVFQLCTRETRVNNIHPNVYVISDDLKLQLLKPVRDVFLSGNKFWYLQKSERVIRDPNNWTIENSFNYKLYKQFLTFTEREKEKYKNNFARNPEYITYGNLPITYSYDETPSTYNPADMNF